MTTIALVGNPNSGKSSLFNQLTGLRQKVANFPGVTVEKKTGRFKLPNGETVHLIDLPGAYSLYPTSQDERMVLNVLANLQDEDFPDAVVYVADVTHLEKHLLLLTQVLDLGLPCLLALNMSDLAEEEGLEIDAGKLSEFLGVEVIPVSGRTGSNVGVLREGIARLLAKGADLFSHQTIYQFTVQEQRLTAQIQEKLGVKNPYRAKLLAHHADQLPFLTPAEKTTIESFVEAAGFENLRQQIAETMQRFDLTGPLVKKALLQPGKQSSLTERLDSVLTHRIFAPLIFFAVMFLVFQAIFAWAEWPMNLIDSGFGALGASLQEVLPAGWFTDLLTEGVISGLGGIIIFVPQIAILFFLITLLEEVGYMARAVFIFDRLMQQFGLNGRSVVALVSGGACAIPAIMSTRTIGNWKERLITIMVTPFISCSARIPVYAVLIGFVVPSESVLGIFNLQGLAFMGLYLLGILAALGSAYVFKVILKSQERSWLMLQLPTYRWPVWRNVLHTVKEKVLTFIWEAGKIIMVISILLWFLASYGPSEKMDRATRDATELAEERALSETATEDLIASNRIEASYAGHIGKAIEPAIRPLGFDWKIGIALITSFAAREVFVGTMATIYSVGSAGDDVTTVREKLAAARNPDTGAVTYTMATALSLLIFYVFAMQCMSTLAVVKRETGSWKWAIIQFFFMTGLAYFSSLLTYQLLA